MNLNIRLCYHFFAVGLYTILAAGFMSSCQQEFMPEKEAEKSDETIYMSTSLKLKNVRATTATTNPEEIVKTVRLIVCDSGTGSVIYNSLHHVAAFSDQPVGADMVWHSPFAITPGRRDFFFIANEGGWGLSTPLAALKNKSELYTNPLFTHINYDPEYKPSEDKPMLLTQAYFDIDVQKTRNGKGDRFDPQHFIADGDEVVELVRSLAKVKLTVKKVAFVEEDNGVFKAKKLRFYTLSNFQKLAVSNIPTKFSLFLNPYFKSLTFVPNQYYTTDFYGTEAGTTREQVLATATTVNRSEATYLKPSLDQQTGATTYFDYITTVYVPEHLRAFAVEENEEGVKPTGAMGWNFFNNSGVAYYKVPVDHQDWTQGIATSTSTAFNLPDAATKYSRYSVLRNHAYEVIAEEREGEARLYLMYEVKPWEDENYYVYLGEYYNVWIEDPTFEKKTQKVRIVTSSPDLPSQFEVGLEVAQGQNATFTESGGGNPSSRILHTNKTYQSHVDYTLNLTSDPTENAPVLLIKFNRNIVYTIKKQTP